MRVLGGILAVLFGMLSAFGAAAFIVESNGIVSGGHQISTTARLAFLVFFAALAALSFVLAARLFRGAQTATPQNNDQR